MQENLAVFSFKVSDETIMVHKFEGETSYTAQDGSGAEIPCINLLAVSEVDLHGMSMRRFFEIFLLSTFKAGYNKNIAIATLNTWVWAAVVGDNGEIRGKPRMFRYVMPADDDGTPFWVLKKNRGRGYRIEALRSFTCRNCDSEFERYTNQFRHDVCQTCVELEKV